MDLDLNTKKQELALKPKADVRKKQIIIENNAGNGARILLDVEGPAGFALHETITIDDCPIRIERIVSAHASHAMAVASTPGDRNLTLAPRGAPTHWTIYAGADDWAFVKLESKMRDLS